MFRILLAILVFLSGCGRERNDSVPTSSSKEALEAKYQLYKSLAPRGWAVSSKCDALLFTSLMHVGLAEAGPIEEAMGQPGQWFRLPSLVSDPKVCSSDISRDMFMGLFSYIWHFKRLDLAEQVWEYGQAHDWKMGEERKGLENRVTLMPATIGLLADIIYHLGGEDHPERHFSALETYSTVPGFTSHLTLIHLHIRGSMRGSLSDQELAVLSKILSHMGSNPLAHVLYHKYTDGDQSVATNLLLSIWPADRLPTEQDWSEEWRTQRSEGDSGFQPGPGDHRHSGGDFLFAAAIVLERI